MSSFIVPYAWSLPSCHSQRKPIHRSEWCITWTHKLLNQDRDKRRVGNFIIKSNVDRDVFAESSDYFKALFISSIVEAELCKAELKQCSDETLTRIIDFINGWLLLQSLMMSLAAVQCLHVVQLIPMC